MTPGKTALVQRFAARLKIPKDRIRIVSVACAAMLAVRLVAGGPSGVQPPPPLEVPYSAFLTIIDKEPSRIDRVRRPLSLDSPWLGVSVSRVSCLPLDPRPWILERPLVFMFVLVLSWLPRP